VAVPTSHVIAASSSGKFLITPSGGLMIWTLIVFGVSMILLAKFAFPPIRANLDKRQKAIEDSIDTAERTREEAEAVLAEYRERLKEARAQAEEIVSRARRTAEDAERDAVTSAREHRDQLLEQTRRDVEAETRRAIGQIREEVAALTVLAAEKVTRKALTADDQRRLVEEALGELDFSALTSEN
jgi:F-type H+-transporting ATPase subunit b